MAYTVGSHRGGLHQAANNTNSNFSEKTPQTPILLHIVVVLISGGRGAYILNPRDVLERTRRTFMAATPAHGIEAYAGYQ